MTAVEYDASLFVLERKGTASAELDEFILDVSRLNASTSTWIPLDSSVATFSYSNAYDLRQCPVEDADGNLVHPDTYTLVPDSETATLSLSYWNTTRPSTSPLFCGDFVRASYDDKVISTFLVDKTNWTYTVDASAAKHGASHRCDFTVSLVSSNQIAMASEVCWQFIEAEPWIDRIQRFVTVVGW